MKNKGIVVAKVFSALFASFILSASGGAFAEDIGAKVMNNSSSQNKASPKAYFASCTINYSMCISKYGTQPGSVWGMSRCGDCLNTCNANSGWWPNYGGCRI